MTYAHYLQRGYSLMVKPLPSKQIMSVRFRLPAPNFHEPQKF